MTTVQGILRNALDLRNEERAELALRLMESLEEQPTDDIEAAWAREVRDRVEALRRGAASTRPAVEVFREARERLAAGK